ncbi:hypothetical protein TRIATDRAFT_302614 [Trichoderma atroviride IMI 206040]|uniref:Uncharacterized protein n=1 Tax=Hypocrea atroviridis (strain ATCC 20476 / IMI 206040) TaxID=452589 RepID=G9PAZ8_HYPAI|nr:uncharacterized protein TRIATDRAFT_302614 [Trichoderma atroviride IMI 206040]EHK40179.1 hypothetical protein TRIATDRAFT_302614 [Trichoderma atroviride IMI 206040]
MRQLKGLSYPCIITTLKRSTPRVGLCYFANSTSIRVQSVLYSTAAQIPQVRGEFQVNRRMAGLRPRHRPRCQPYRTLGSGSTSTLKGPILC